MGDSAHTTHHTNPEIISTPPFFSKMKTFSKNRPCLLKFCCNSVYNRHGLFLKNILIIEKKGAAFAFPAPGLYGGLYGQNISYKFKKPYDDRANYGLDTTSRIFETEMFWMTTSRSSFTRA